MHSRQILTVLVFVLMSVVAEARGGQKRAFFEGGGSGEGLSWAQQSVNPNRSDTPAQVERMIASLEQQVRVAMPPARKQALVRLTLQQIDQLRRQSPVHTIDKEIAMDYATESLRPMAEDQQFQRGKCTSYKYDLLSRFEPQSEGRPVHPVLKRSYSIIEGVCS